jgi:ribosomal protein S12 methylthiotransferase
MSQKRYYIEKLGCAKNQVDAEIIAARLDEKGWTYTEKAEEADLIIINSCGFIDSARKEAIELTIGARESYPGAKILFAGCMAQRYGEALLQELPEIDGVFGNLSPERVDELADSILTGDRSALLPQKAGTCYERKRLFSFPGSAYLRISEGCDHCCSYCAIPIIRGALRSRPLDEILAEAGDLIKRGVLELNLVAQDLAAYGKDLENRSLFPELLSGLSRLEGDFWVRMLYIHPDNFPEEILPILQSDPRILPYFDIPFQHAHPEILRSMGRTGDSETYLGLIEKIRSALPGCSIRSTFLLGYPGEKGRHQRELKQFISRARLEWAGFFLYSREEGTRASILRGPLMHALSRPSARKRMEELQVIQQEISIACARERVGMETGILIEEQIEKEELSLGRAWFQAPEVDGATVVSGGVLPLAPGRKVLCRIRRNNGFDLEAVVL